MATKAISHQRTRSLDWPLSREEKKSRVLRLYDADVQAANQQLQAGEVKLEVLRGELKAIRRASGSSNSSGRLSACCAPENEEASGRKLQRSSSSSMVSTVASLPAHNDTEGANDSCEVESRCWEAVEAAAYQLGAILGVPSESDAGSSRGADDEAGVLEEEERKSLLVEPQCNGHETGGSETMSSMSRSWSELDFNRLPRVSFARESLEDAASTAATDIDDAGSSHSLGPPVTRSRRWPRDCTEHSSASGSASRWSRHQADSCHTTFASVSEPGVATSIPTSRLWHPAGGKQRSEATPNENVEALTPPGHRAPCRTRSHEPESVTTYYPCADGSDRARPTIRRGRRSLVGSSSDACVAAAPRRVWRGAASARSG